MKASEVVDKFSTLRTGDFKKQLADLIIKHLEPVQEKYNYIIKNKDALDEFLIKGRDKARETAAKTLADVKKVIGFLGL